MELEERLNNSLRIFAVNTGVVMGGLTVLGLGVGLIAKLRGYEGTEGYTHIGMMLRCAASAIMEEPTVYLPWAWAAFKGLMDFSSSGKEYDNEEGEDYQEDTRRLESSINDSREDCARLFHSILQGCEYYSDGKCNYGDMSDGCPLEKKEEHMDM